ncbi:ATP-dependent DNA helicase PIF1-like [Argopecten irradians]|uniref:ATP-dependent DNA helicase PIF1-like n=1 Tax=Argopecten irradians TaxID=31199 RepID=UPI003713BB6B
MIERYSKRPKQLELWCLADYVSQLEVTFPKDLEKPVSKEGKNDDDEEEEITCDDQIDKQETSHSEMDAEEFRATDVLVTLKNGIKIRKRKNDRVIRFVGFSKKTNAENYYREKLLLYLPWRNEQKDVLGNYDTYEEHYRNKADIVQVKQRVYEHFMEELEQAIQQAEDDSCDFDEVAPNTEHIEAEDADVGSTPSEDFIHFDPDSVQHKHVDIGPELGLGSKPSDVETSAVRLPDNEYHTLLQSLNPKQREFHNHVTKFIRDEDEPLFAFLTGGAGTGKSVVIDAVYQTLHRLLCSEEGEDPEDVRIMLCAYTGKAAYNIGGTTIASAFHKKMYQTQQHMHADELNSLRTKFRNLSVVIIDEISMVGNKLLTFINERLQQVKGKKTDFGGISVIAVGDLYQLQPVADSWIFKDLSSPGQGLATNLWKKHFKVFELDEIMRQKGDVPFTELLNRLRHGELSPQDKLLLSERKVDQGHESYPSSIPHLFIENRFVDDFNSNLIQKLHTSKVTVKADTDILSQTKMSAEVKKTLVQALPDKQSTTGQLKTSLTIAVDMIYDISVNLEVSDGLTNGATCVVKHIEYKDSNTRPAIVWVLFNDHKVGVSRRNQYKHLYTSGIHENWTPIFETKRTFVYNRKTYERIQFPLQPSAAKTVHKAQGATLTDVVVTIHAKFLGFTEDSTVVHTRFGERTKRTGLIADANNDSIQLTVWGNISTSLEQGSSYKIINGCIKKFEGQLLVSTISTTSFVPATQNQL